MNKKLMATVMSLYATTTSNKTRWEFASKPSERPTHS